MHRQTEQAEAIRPLVCEKGQPQLVAVMPDEIARVRSLVSAIASVEVRKIPNEFGAVLQSIRSADLAITGIDEVERQTGRPVDSKDWGGTATNFHARIQADRHQLVAIENRLHEQVRRELRR